jgi:very-short-patch-repair endonuclease
MWSFIRQHGGIFYPQYPLLNCFIDFANPKAKVGIECDGAAYHDIKKDAKRDRLFEEHGWIIYRFKGSECVKDLTSDTVKNLIDLHGVKRGA